MSIRLWHPYERSLIGRIFDDTEGMLGHVPASDQESVKMLLDVKETPNEFIVSADVPGVAKEDIHASVKDNVLTLSAERKREESGGDDKTHWSERTYGHVSRSIRLPKGVVAEKISAKHEHGVLKLTVPKAPEDKPKHHQIAIN